MKISIASTSFLPPGLEAWSNIEEKKNIKFLNYGDLSNFKESGDIEISIIFLKDLVDYYENSKNQKKNKDKIDKIIKLLSSKGGNYKNYIICFSEFFYSNSIENSKKIRSTKLLKEYFIRKIYSVVNSRANFYFLDLDEIFSNFGLKNCFDQRNFYISRCHLSYFGIEKLTLTLNQIITRIYNSSKKVLILDCDNTLWGGVLGEDGINKILIGQDGVGLAFLEFQKAVIKIKNRGIILAIASKNKHEDVEKVFKSHKSMFIKNHDITSYKVNWNEKYRNILSLSQDLFLGLNSFVFWDDNPIERKKVKLNLKEVEVVEPKIDVSDWPKQLLELPSLSKFNVSKDDLNKTNQYKNREKFLNQKKIFVNEIDYLRSINIKPSVVKLDNSNIARAEQMIMKTNQFNMNIKRINLNDLKKMNSNLNKHIFLVHLKDEYGDHGIVSLVALDEGDKNMKIELFLMSCRIIGRYLENWILEKIRKRAFQKNKEFIIAEYLKTGRNDIAIDFLNKNNFKKITMKMLPKFLDKKKINYKYEYSQISKDDQIDNINIYK